MNELYGHSRNPVLAGGHRDYLQAGREIPSVLVVGTLGCDEVGSSERINQGLTMTTMKLTAEELVDRAAQYLWVNDGFKQAVYLDRKTEALEEIRAVVRQAVEDATKNEKDRLLQIVRETHPADGVEGCGCAAEITKRARCKARPSFSE